MKNILFSISFLLVLLSSKAQTYVSGGISTNTIWSKTASPYIVTDTVIIYPGVKLTIEPGVTVKFVDTSRLEIREAKIEAIGTAIDPIVFTSNSTILKSGNWGDIYINNVNVDTLKFKYCNFNYATNAICKYLSVFGVLVVQNCNFSYCETGIISKHSGVCLIDSSTFSNMTYRGIRIMGYHNYINSCTFFKCKIGVEDTIASGGSIKNCQIDSNQIGLSYFRGLIQDCKITNNEEGIRGDSYGGTKIKNNTISGNSKYGIQSYNDSIKNCTIYDNNIGIIALNNTIIENQITNNVIGINIPYYSSKTVITCNKICSNSVFDLEYLGELISGNSSFPNNYFCTPDSTSTRPRVFDGYVDVKYGLVNFMPLDTSCYKTLGVKENKLATQNNLKLYPNPFTNTATLEFDNPQSRSHQLSVFNTLGQLVMSIGYINSNKVLIDRKDLQSGLYFYQLRNDEGVVGSGKMMLE